MSAPLEASCCGSSCQSSLILPENLNSNYVLISTRERWILGTAGLTVRIPDVPIQGKRPCDHLVVAAADLGVEDGATVLLDEVDVLAGGVEGHVV